MNEMIKGILGATPVHMQNGEGGILLEKYESDNLTDAEKHLFDMILIHNNIDPKIFKGSIEIYESK